MNKQVLVVFMSFLMYIYQAACSQALPKAQCPDPGILVAVVAGRCITDAELEASVASRLLRLRSEEYTIRRSALEEYIDSLLIEAEAKRRGCSVGELLRKEVYDAVPPVTQQEAEVVVETGSPQAYGSQPREVALKLAAASLRAKRETARRGEFVASLRGNHEVAILLSPPRLERKFTGGQSRGPVSAPVSIVEFSDFQCPYCARLNETLARVLKEYPSQIRLTFMQFPLPSHPQASPAAEASLCAAEQGRFWQMHDALFGNQTALGQGKFSELAKSVGLEDAAFQACLDSQRPGKLWRAELAEGRSVGISGTPALFINGRMFAGAVPYETLRGIIDEELKTPRAEASLTRPARD
jgi:predicted DsbA family dithiol-disulfide isomerase